MNPEAEENVWDDNQLRVFQQGNYTLKTSPNTGGFHHTNGITPSHVHQQLPWTPNTHTHTMTSFPKSGEEGKWAYKDVEADAIASACNQIELDGGFVVAIVPVGGGSYLRIVSRS